MQVSRKAQGETDSLTKDLPGLEVVHRENANSRTERWRPSRGGFTQAKVG